MPTVLKKNNKKKITQEMEIEGCETCREWNI